MRSQRHKHDASRSSRLCLAACAPFLLTVHTALAQGLHETDIAIRQSVDGTIESARQGDAGLEWGSRVFGGRLDQGQFANLTDDPGFDSFSGAFPAGSVIGLDILAALRVWENDTFNMIDPEYAMSVTKGNEIITTPETDTRVPGFTFGSADANGRFHHHVRFFLDPFDPSENVPGLWMLTFELWSTNVAVLPSEPIYLVFASGSEAVGQQADAMAWIEQNLVGGPCSPADIAEPEGVLDLNDITAFASAFQAQSGEADLAEPIGVFDLNDISAFVSAFTAGCP